MEEGPYVGICAVIVPLVKYKSRGGVWINPWQK